MADAVRGYETFLQGLNSNDWGFGECGQREEIGQIRKQESWLSMLALLSAPTTLSLILYFLTCWNADNNSSYTWVVLRIQWDNLMYVCDLQAMSLKCQTKQIVTSLLYDKIHCGCECGHVTGLLGFSACSRNEIWTITPSLASVSSLVKWGYFWED